MDDVIQLPDNMISTEDRQRLEAFGGHTIARGRGTRWHWSVQGAGVERFELFAGGADERLIASLERDRQAGLFRAFDADNREFANGNLQQIMTALERYLAARHGELPDAPA
jgi:hypothetical protein